VSRMTPFDFVLALIIGDLLDDILWMEVSYVKGVVAAGTLVAVHILDQALSYTSATADRLLNGRPTLLVNKGQPLPDGLARERVSQQDLDTLIRCSARIDPPDTEEEIEQAQLELNGHLSLRRRPEAGPAQKRDRDRLEVSP
jgi:uncharacterized membrane protein YcaP (DUF421 family)